MTAFAPMAFFLSAVYSESLYLALSVGVFWSAREGRWALAGLLGGLAAATRSTGLVLLLPVLALYLYGPRRDRAPDRRAGHRLAPRYRLRADVLWLALIPAAVALFSLWLGLSGGDALAPFRSQEIWGRHFAGPYWPSGTACAPRSRAPASSSPSRAHTCTSRPLQGARRSPPRTT